MRLTLVSLGVRTFWALCLLIRRRGVGLAFLRSRAVSLDPNPRQWVGCFLFTLDLFHKEIEKMECVFLVETGKQDGLSRVCTRIVEAECALKVFAAAESTFVALVGDFSLWLNNSRPHSYMLDGSFNDHRGSSCFASSLRHSRFGSLTGIGRSSKGSTRYVTYLPMELT